MFFGGGYPTGSSFCLFLFVNLDRILKMPGDCAKDDNKELFTKMHCVLITRTHGQRTPFILVKRSLQPSLG